MPLGYGSQYVGVQLSSEEIATQLYKQTSPGIGLTGFLRILLTIGEILGGFIPGIGVIGSTAIALAAGISNEALDVYEGNANVASSVLNLAAPFIGGGFSGFGNLRRAEEISDSLTSLNSLAYRGFEEGNVARDVTESYYRAASQAERITQYQDFTSLQAFNRGTELFPKGALETGFGGFSENYGLVNIFTNASEITIPGIALSTEAIDDIVDDIEFANFLERSGMSAELIAELKVLLRGAKTFEEQRSILLGFVRNLAPKDAIALFRAVTGEIETVLLNEAWQLPYARVFAAEYDSWVEGHLLANSDFYGLTPGMIPSNFEIEGESYFDKVRRQLSDRRKPLMKRIVEWLGSSDFNDKIVQRGQAILDPNDLGRAGVEHLYKEMKEYIGTYFTKTAKLLRGADKIEDAFVASGGRLIVSDWIMGYKVIKDLGIGSQLVMIQFKAAESNGKRPVIVMATDAELDRFILSPGRTYQRLWALSKGGKSLGLSKIFGASAIFKMGRQASTVLGFLPIQALRNVLSLVSNLVENSADVANGTYFKTYQKKFMASLSRTAVSRTFRLFGRVGIGGYASQRFGREIGSFLGREAQRIGTTIFAKGIQNVMAGKSFGNGIARAAETGVLVSIRGNALRHLRHYNPNSAIAMTLSARRKMYQIKRIPNAFIPGRPFKGIKF